MIIQGRNIVRISLQSASETKNESLFAAGRKPKNCFLKYLIEYWISSATVEKYLLKAITYSDWA